MNASNVLRVVLGIIAVVIGSFFIRYHAAFYITVFGGIIMAGVGAFKIVYK